MTMTSRNRAQAATHGTREVKLVEWTIVQAGLWVGKINGEFAGMIEQILGTGFVATAKHEGDLGVFVTIDDAKASFAA